MNKNIKMGIIIWVTTGILAAIGYGFGQYYFNKGRTEIGKKGNEGIKENNNNNTEKILDAVSDVKTDVELLRERQELFETFIKNSIDPRFHKILSEKGYTLEQLEKLANQAIENSKDFFELGNAYFVKENYEKAIKYFEKSLENAPDKIPTNTQFNLGQAKYKLIEKKYNVEFIDGELIPKKAKPLLNEVISHYSEAIVKSPNYYQAYNNRGIVYLKLRLITKAELDFEKSKLINPNNPNPYVNLSKCYLLKNNPNYINTAFQLLNRAIEIDSAYYVAYYNRGNIYEMHFNQFDKAIEDYQMCLKLGFKSKHVYNNMGITYYRWGKCSLADENFNLALKIDRNFQNSIIGKKNIEILRKAGKCE